MPFIKQWRRHAIDKHGLESLSVIEPGDRCYVHYRNMMRDWKDNRSWSTFHQMTKNMLNDINEEESIARFLAWQVFFALNVLPYEIEKRKENGDI